MKGARAKATDRVLTRRTEARDGEKRQNIE